MFEPFELLLLLLLPLLLLELRIFGTFDTLMEIELLFEEKDFKYQLGSSLFPNGIYLGASQVYFCLCFANVSTDVGLN